MGSYSNYYESSKMLHGSLLNMMGTRLDVLLIGVEEAQSMQIWSIMVEEMKRLDKMLNKYDDESELSGINRQAVHAPVSLNDELWTILLDCQRYHHLTKGYFDISLKDFSKVCLNRADHSVFFKNEAIQLDLGGYAKGYALERIKAFLNASGITQAFLNFGNSSVLALGSHPHGENWIVGINDPYHPEKIIGTIGLYNNAMSTSGNMPQRPEHIINPHTGEYSKERKIISVAAKNAIDAEALTTALMVTGEEEAQDILSHFNIDKYLVFNL